MEVDVFEMFRFDSDAQIVQKSLDCEEGNNCTILSEFMLLENLDYAVFVFGDFLFFYLESIKNIEFNLFYQSHFLLYLFFFLMI